MAQFQSISYKEKIYREIQLIRCENLFCTKCVRQFTTKSEFNQHIQGHMEENGGRRSYMSYIEKYICSNCDKTFEVKSDLIIHYNTVCFDAPYRCKHCRENCENSPFLQMHLLIHHNYSEEMLREEGFLADLDDNPFKSQRSFMKSVKSRAFQTPTSEVIEESYNLDNTLTDPSFINRKFRKTKFKRQDLAFNLMDKGHTCEICNESFSRKCKLDMHVQKHTFEASEEKNAVRDQPLTTESCKSKHIPTRNIMRRTENTASFEAIEQYSNIQEHIQQSNTILGSSIWKKFHLTSKFESVKSFVSTRNEMRKSENTDISEVVEQSSSNKRGILQPSNVVLGSSVWKKVQPRRKCQQMKPSSGIIMRKKKKNIPKVTRQHLRSSTAILQPHNTVLGTYNCENAKLKRRLKGVTTSNEQKVPKTANASKKPKSRKIKLRKKKSKNEAKHPPSTSCTKQTSQNNLFICELCNKGFTDNYKLKRHSFIHSGERPYTCTKCQKTFARDDHLKRHIIKVCSKKSKAK